MGGDWRAQWVRPEELEVMRLHMQGFTDASIARRLGVSEATVRRRAGRVRQRTGARTRAEAIALLAVAGLLPVDTTRLPAIHRACAQEPAQESRSRS